MAKTRFAEGMKILPILTPIDITETTTSTAIVDLKTANWATLAFHFGAITCDAPTVTVLASTAATTASATAISFSYRLSSPLATDTDTWGAITAASTTGVGLAVTDDSTLLLIDVDPSVVAAEGADKRFIRGLVTVTGGSTACVVGAVAYIETRYPGNSQPIVRTT